MTETLIVEELAYILASHCEGEWFSYLFSVLRKLSYKLGKNGKIFKFLLHPFICPKKPELKKFDVFKRSLPNPRTNYESMDSVFVLGPEIYKLSMKELRKFFQEKLSTFSRKTKASYLMKKTWLAQKNLAVFLKEEWFLYLSSVLRNMS